MEKIENKVILSENEYEELKKEIDRLKNESIHIFNDDILFPLETYYEIDDLDNKEKWGEFLLRVNTVVEENDYMWETINSCIADAIEVVATEMGIHQLID